jgi:hypothetical protein
VKAADPSETSLVRRVDHVNIVVPEPRRLFEFLTTQLEIPIERPWARFAAFESGQAMLGIGHEPITYAPGRRTGVPANAGFFAIAFEPEPLERALPELARRALPHSLPYEFAVTYRDDPGAFALDESAGAGMRRRRWTLVSLGGLLGDAESARALARWPRRGDAPGARLLGRALGRLGSGRLGGMLVARLGSSRPFCFLCEFHSFDVGESRALAAGELARRGGGPLGLVRTRELVVTVADLAAQLPLWEQLLGPPDSAGRWQLGDGPAIRVIEGPDDCIRTVVWEVESLGRAADELRARGWFGEPRDDSVAVAAPALQGLDVRLAARE